VAEEQIKADDDTSVQQRLLLGAGTTLGGVSEIVGEENEIAGGVFAVVIVAFVLLLINWRPNTPVDVPHALSPNTSIGTPSLGWDLPVQFLKVAIASYLHCSLSCRLLQVVFQRALLNLVS